MMYYDDEIYNILLLLLLSIYILCIRLFRTNKIQYKIDSTII